MTTGNNPPSSDSSTESPSTVENLAASTDLPLPNLTLFQQDQSGSLAVAQMVMRNFPLYTSVKARLDAVEKEGEPTKVLYGLGYVTGYIRDDDGELLLIIFLISGEKNRQISCHISPEDCRLVEYENHLIHNSSMLDTIEEDSDENKYRYREVSTNVFMSNIQIIKNFPLGSVVTANLTDRVVVGQVENYTHDYNLKNPNHGALALRIKLFDYIKDNVNMSTPVYITVSHNKCAKI